MLYIMYVLFIIYFNIYCHLIFYHLHSCIILLRLKAIGPNKYFNESILL